MNLLADLRDHDLVESLDAPWAEGLAAIDIDSGAPAPVRTNG